MTDKPTDIETATKGMDAAAIRALVSPLVIEWIDLMGTGPTLALVKAYPGVQLKVPVGRKTGNMSRRLARILGHEAAEAFIGRYGGEHLTVPSCAALMRSLRNAEIIAAYDDGEKLHDLAMDYGLTVRQLRNVLNRPATTIAPTRQRFLGNLGDGNPNQLQLIPTTHT